MLKGEVYPKCRGTSCSWWETYNVYFQDVFLFSNKASYNTWWGIFSRKDHWLTERIQLRVTKFFFKDFILFLDRGEGREEERERNIDVWLLLVHPIPGTWPTTQACAQTGNRTCNPLAHRPVLNALSHTNQGRVTSFKNLLKSVKKFNKFHSLDFKIRKREHKIP